MSEKVLPQDTDIIEGYGGDKERLSSYATLMGIFNLIFAVVLLIAKGTGRDIPERVDTKDIALRGMATHYPRQPGVQPPRLKNVYSFHSGRGPCQCTDTARWH